MTEHRNYFSYSSPFVGEYTVVASRTAIERCARGVLVPTDALPGETPLIRRFYEELEAYLSGELQAFTVPVQPQGTPFRKRVWQALQAIPYGETRSYRFIAEQVGSPRAARAVGAACHCNPLPFIIPCHRVIGSNGSLTGFAYGTDLKAALLKLEGDCRQAKKR